MRTPSRYILACWTASCLVACGGPELDVGEATNPIIGGTVVTNANNTGMVMLPGCSGTLIRNDWVLTADHCVDTAHDTDFDLDGKVLAAFPGATGQGGEAVAVDSSDRVIIGGWVIENGEEHFALARFDQDGALDTSFSGDGRQSTNIYSASSERITALAIDASGRIIAGGHASVKGIRQFALARYLANGSLDSSFDHDGKVLTNFASGSGEYITAVTMDGSGRIVAAGYAWINGSYQFALARYLANGALDPSFDHDGKVLTNFHSRSIEKVHDVAIDSQGRIVVAGYAGGDFALARYKANGSLDGSFDYDGKVLTSFSDFTSAEASGVAIDAQDRVVAAGHARVSGSNQLALARYKVNGQLDPTFGDSGKVVTDIASTSSEAANDVVIDQFGRIVVAGWANYRGSIEFALARYNATGGLDPTFDGDGKLLTKFGTATEERIKALAIDSGGQVVVGGFARVGAACQFAGARYHGEQLDRQLPAGFTVTMGNQQVAGDRVFKHPGELDVALIRLANPMSMFGSFVNHSMVLNSSRPVAGRRLECYGYGRSTYNGGGGVLRSAVLVIDTVGLDRYVIKPNSLGQIQWSGDSGGSCLWNGSLGSASQGGPGGIAVAGVPVAGATKVVMGVQSTSVGIDSLQSVESSTQSASHAFRGWALSTIAAN